MWQRTLLFSCFSVQALESNPSTLKNFILLRKYIIKYILLVIFWIYLEKKKKGRWERDGWPLAGEITLMTV